MKCACLSSRTNMDIPKNKDKPSHFRHVLYVGRDGKESMAGIEEERIIHHKIAVNGKESEITITLPKQSGLHRSASMQQVPSLQQASVQQKSSILQRSVSFQQGSTQDEKFQQNFGEENSSLQAKQKKSSRKSGKLCRVNDIEYLHCSVQNSYRPVAQGYLFFGQGPLLPEAGSPGWRPKKTISQLLKFQKNYITTQIVVQRGN